ncbi:MAG: hypothetical protein ACRDNZ_22910 [Streptosporangiaceae bacterium]
MRGPAAALHRHGERLRRGATRRSPRRAAAPPEDPAHHGALAAPGGGKVSGPADGGFADLGLR